MPLPAISMETIKGPRQTSFFSCIELNVNERMPLFELICIEFDAWKVRRLSRGWHNLSAVVLAMKLFGLVYPSQNHESNQMHVHAYIKTLHL